MKKEERNERVSGWRHEMLKRDLNNIKVCAEGLSNCVNYGNKGYILDEIKSMQKLLKLMENTLKDA